MKQLTQPILMIAFLLLLTTVQGQDPRFSQYYASPFSLNPALTGVFSGQWRATVNYRDQWNSILAPVPFRTYAAAGEYRQAIGRTDYWAGGIGVLHDEAGTSRFSQNRAHLSGAYLKQLAGGRNRNEHYLSVGAQAGFGQNSIDYSKLWFSRQYDGINEVPDPNSSSGETDINGNSPVFLDFNAGLLWYMVMENEGFFYVGASAHHLNRPDVGLFNNAPVSLYTRWSGQVGGQLPVSENFSILPGLQIMKQGPSFETDLGANIRFTNHDLNELALRMGAWVRVGNRLTDQIQTDAVTVVTMLELERFMVGLSYDMTVSSLRNANNSRGAFEISLTYYHPEHRRSKVTCPRF